MAIPTGSPVARKSSATSFWQSGIWSEKGAILKKFLGSKSAVCNNGQSFFTNYIHTRKYNLVWVSLKSLLSKSILRRLMYCSCVMMWIMAKIYPSRGSNPSAMRAGFANFGHVTDLQTPIETGNLLCLRCKTKACKLFNVYGIKAACSLLLYYSNIVIMNKSIRRKGNCFKSTEGISIHSAVIWPFAFM